MPDAMKGELAKAQQVPGKELSRKDRILDAAEMLFAAHGFEAVTMRKIAASADVDVALASYHFGSKRGLFDAVLLRRAEVLNTERLDALAAYQKSASSRGDENGPSVEEIIDAYLRPLLVRRTSSVEEAGWRHYYALIARINNSPQWGGEVMTRYFDPLAHSFVDALKNALPDTSEADLYWGYHILSGALTLTFAQTGRIDNLSDGLCRSEDMEAAYERMVPFMAAGLRRLGQ